MAEPVVDDALRADPPARALRWVASTLGDGARIVSCRRLAGATSSAVHALDMALASGTLCALVLRRFVRADWLAREPDLASREASALRALLSLPIPTPELVASDTDASQCDVPAVLMTRLPGRVELGAALDVGQLARVLPVLHDAGPTGYPDRPYAPYHDLAATGAPTWLGDAPLRERVRRLLAGPLPAESAVPLHRDYHPMNVLLRGGHISGVVDWVNACRGPAAVDVAHCRINLVGLRDRAAADAFLAAWRAASGRPFDPVWDLVATCDGDLLSYRGWPEGAELHGVATRRARIADHVARALAELSA